MPAALKCKGLNVTDRSTRRESVLASRGPKCGVAGGGRVGWEVR